MTVSEPFCTSLLKVVYTSEMEIVSAGYKVAGERMLLIVIVRS